MNFKTIIVTDAETNGRNPNECSIVQLASIAIDPRNLTIIKDSGFNVNMKPDFSTNEDNTVRWHARRLNIEEHELLEMWDAYPEPKVVWPEYLAYLRKYHTKQERQTKFTAPIPAGNNIIYFDLPIYDRYHNQYGNGKRMFAVRDVIDLMHWFFPWFENDKDITSFSMDNMREYFGISKEGAHDALKDVKDSAALVIKFLNVYRQISPKVRFKGAFKK